MLIILCFSVDLELIWIPAMILKSTTVSFFCFFSGEKQSSGAFYGGVFTGLSCSKRGPEQGFKLWVRIITVRQSGLNI